MIDFGVVVLGHGSRAGIGNANQSVYLVADMLKIRFGHDLVEPAILTADSGCQTMEEAVARLAARGVAQIVIAPLLLSAGAHLSQGIPAELQQIRSKLTGVKFVLAGPIGADPRIADILFDRIKQAQVVEDEEISNG